MHSITDASIGADLRITLTDDRFSTLQDGGNLDDIALGEVGDIVSISVRVGASRCEGAVTIDSSAASVDVELGELAMMQLRLGWIAFLDWPTFVVLPDGADWQAFDRVTVERQRGRQAPTLPSEEDMVALLKREVECRSS